MNNDKLVRVDGINWLPDGDDKNKYPVPLCPQHNIRMRPIDPVPELRIGWEGEHIWDHSHATVQDATQLKCEDGGGHVFTLSRNYRKQREHVIDKVNAMSFAKMKVINLDDVAMPIADKELRDTDYWIKAKVTDSKSGTRLIIWAGSKARKNKAQLFIEPELQRMSFDQNDDHPTVVFTKVEAIFKDTLNTIIEKN